MDENAVLQAKLQGIEGQLSTFISKADAELKLFGTTSTETKSAIDRLATEGKAVQDRLLAIEQKLSRPDLNQPERRKSVGERFIESEQFGSLAKGARSSGKVNIGAFHEKTAIVNAVGQNQPLVQPAYIPGIVTPPQAPLKIRSLFPNLPTSSNLIYYVQETSFTNNAGIQGAGTSPQVYENVVKPESALAFQLLYAPVQTIGHWIPVSRQILEDSPALRGYIDARLMYGLRLAEDGAFLNGTGVGASIKGIVTAATAYDTGLNVSGDTKIDTVLRAGTQVQASYYPWEFTIMNPADWTAIQLIKTTGSASSGQYVFADPHAVEQPRLWGRPVVESYSLASGHFVVGSSMAATVWDRDDATIEISLEHSDFFVRNMAAVLCEERAALTVQVPAALIYGAFPS